MGKSRVLVFWFSLTGILYCLSGCPFDGGDVDTDLNLLPPPPPANINQSIGYQPTPFTSDGQWLYYVAGKMPSSDYATSEWDLDVWKIKLDGSEAATKVIDTPDQNTAHSIWVSPDGQKLLQGNVEWDFSQGFPSPLPDAKISDIDGKNQTDIDTDGEGATFSSNPDSILAMKYYPDRINNYLNFQIILLDYNGSTVEVTLDHTIGDGTGWDWLPYFPVSSPRGGHILLTYFRGNSWTLSELWGLNSDGTGLTKLTEGGFEIFRTERGLTEDRVYFAGYSADGITTDIFSIRWDGTDLTNLTNSPDVSEFNPVVRPDGNKILYSAYDFTTPWGFWEMNTDGTDPQLLISFVDTKRAFPFYSPDGNTIVYHIGTFDYWSLGIYTRGDTPAERLLVDNPGGTAFTGYGHMNAQPMLRAEAIHNLEALYTAQLVYYQNYGTYTDDFNALGWAPAGKNIFHYYLGVSSPPTFPSSDPDQTGCTTFFWAQMSPASSTGFTAAATAALNNLGDCDNFFIDENGVFTITVF